MAIEPLTAEPFPPRAVGHPWVGFPRGTRAIPLLLWGILGFILVIWANSAPRLPAPHADSMSYMEAARAMAEGRAPETSFVQWDAEAGVVRLSHFPPGTSSLMAIPLVLGMDPVGAATILNALAAGVLLLSVALLGGWFAGAPGAVLAPLSLLSSPELVRLYVGVWSEPAFLAVAALATLVMWRAPGRPLIYGLLAAASLAIRYAGVPLVVLSVLVATRNAPRAGRAKAAALAGGPGLAFAVWWALWSSRGGGGVRSTGLYSDGLAAQMDQGVSALLAWGWSGGSAAIGGMLLFASVLLVARSVRTTSPFPWAGLLTFAALYLGFVVLSRMVADPHIPFDERLLAPLMVAWLAFMGAQLVSDLVTKPRWRLPLVIALGGWVAVGAFEIRGGLASVRTQGMHYSSTHWDAPQLFEALAESAEGSTIYSNEPELLLFRAGLIARRLPRAGVVYRDDELAGRLNEAGALVVLIPPFRRGELTVDELVAGTALEVVLSSPQGWLLSRAVGEVELAPSSTQ